MQISQAFTDKVTHTENLLFFMSHEDKRVLDKNTAEVPPLTAYLPGLRRPMKYKSTDTVSFIWIIAIAP